MARKHIVRMAGMALLLTSPLWSQSRGREQAQIQTKVAEELVYARSTDGVTNAGVTFTAPQDSARPTAIIWVHGWGANFYSPTYVAIGRQLAARGFTTISVNTRMHDVGNVEKYTSGGKRVRGGGYWGVTSEDARDIAAWSDYAERLGFTRVILVGHSAGWWSVAHYQAETGDRRVAGLVLASPGVGGPPVYDKDLVAQARNLVAAGGGEDLLRLPNRSFPAFISAATYLDMENSPPEYKDFFGFETETPGILRVKCPILAFFGTKGDVGGEKELSLLKAAVQRRVGSLRNISTTMIIGADHMYTGQEAQVAGKIAHWADTGLAKDPK